MTTTWYECKIKYRKTDDNGVQKMTSEMYLVDAATYTEAEARITEEMSAYISEEFKITTIKTANFSEIHPFENCDRWFKSKVSLIAFDLISNILHTLCTKLSETTQPVSRFIIAFIR